MPGSSRLADGRAWPEMMAAVRIGLNVVDLRRARHVAPPATREALDAVLDGLAAEFRARAATSRPTRGRDARRLAFSVLDEALSAAALAPGGARDDLLSGLVGLRLGLFPDAPGPAAPPREAVLLPPVAA